VGFVYLVAALVFDDEVHKYALRVGFSMRSSRAKKFYLFFFLIGLFVAIVIIYKSFTATWTMPQDWIVNANEFADKSCTEKFREDASNQMGLSQTFFKSSVLFILMGMIFGWPYAMHHFKALALQWINTSLWRRFIRLIVGLSIAFGINYFFNWLTSKISDVPTKFFFGYAFPGFIVSYWIFGIFPIICKWLHLVQKEEELDELFPEIAGKSDKRTRQNTMD